MDSKRKLIRLGVALLLVIVVMREAGKPGLYQTFFGSRGDQFVEVQTHSNAANKLARKNRSSPSESERVESDAAMPINEMPSAEMPSADRSSIAVWAQSLPIELQRAWAQTLVRLKSGGDGDTTPGPTIKWTGVTADQISRSIESLHSESELQSADIVTRIAKDCDVLQAGARDGVIDAAIWTQVAPWATAMLDGFERSFLQQVSDGTFWLGGDHDAFYLALARGVDLDSESGITTGTLPLLQQPDVYRGQSIRIAGRLQLAEKKSAQDNSMDIFDYWTLWIIPDDGGVRPSVLITAELPDVLQRSLNADGTWNRKANTRNPDGQLISIGRFIKRLPYRSSIGADLAPVMIGRVVAIKGDATAGVPGPVSLSDTDPTTERSKTARGTISSKQGMLGIVLAIAAGIALASVVMVRSAADAKRTRRMRNQSADRTLISIDDGHDVRDADPAMPLNDEDAEAKEPIT